MSDPVKKPKMKLDFTGVQETLLATLYSRWYDFQLPKLILGDKHAVEIVDQLDYDFTKLRMRPGTCASLCLRARTFDRWTSEFLDAHGDQDVTVLHLAAGFDTRALRLQDNCGSNVHWIDLDVPDVVDMRRKLIPEPQLPGGYELIAASVTDNDWLTSLPPHRPTVVVFEGLSCYLKPEEMRSMVERVTGHFKTGQLLFDAVAWIIISCQNLMSITRTTGAVLSWGTDDPHELEAWHEGLKLKDIELMSDNKDNKDLSPKLQWILWFVAHMPYFRYVGRHLRYEW
ncbi:putative tetracenomycin polyketide synthesis o-methyltransferase tcmp protein [Phaeoacremonium minimum UCRPA7]|uniref:Putative tetracenomycin polyketide synthesis o-methyltransferase tcmp protein n=1 Tax=Phaeoacremonium minimum (strain UCR-PA7) TaxID=1286976 RepID=R8BK99_PHAM7|nr:putative tetracenomycin polyketide synthesis o-methyltransferase tcmp protein [Phaeoacremonium minimum UCRPA7]EON99778.1 putative tetracenomycin polyketide synthesis o-methyltransferase tcmp protein [Phaeoacremonium minimum UCRPA7]